ncbi:MAG: hypothetical protein RLZZ255_343, partial [Cyanobacteriota bacterium]
MVCLQLRGTTLGDVDAVLFDKDGTLSISEPQLLTLATARVFLCLEQAAPALPASVLPELQQLLERAYGLGAAARILLIGLGKDTLAQGQGLRPAHAHLHQGCRRSDQVVVAAGHGGDARWADRR